MWSPCETVEQVVDKLPGFIDPSALRGCMSVARHIPDLASSFYLECRLGPDTQLDLLAYTHCKGIGTALEEALPIAERSGAWQQNLSLLREWNNDSSDLAEAPCVWFEYDDGGNADHVPQASLSIALQAQYYRHHIEPNVPFDRVVARRMAQAALSQLLPRAQVASRARAVDAVFSALPHSGTLGYLSVMNARNPVVVKLYAIVPRSELHRFLSAIQWRGNADALQEQLATYYAPFQQTVCLDLTLSDRVEARLGLATSQFHRRELGAAKKGVSWLVLPERLSQQKTALSTWPGLTQYELGGRRVWIRRWLDVKAVITADDVSYKAYLGFMPVLAPPLLPFPVS